MTARKELEYRLQEANRRQLVQGEIDRRQFLERSLLAGLGIEIDREALARFAAR